MKTRETLLWLVILALVGGGTFAYMRILDLENELESLQGTVRAEQAARFSYVLQTDNRLDELERNSQKHDRDVFDLMNRVDLLEYRQNLLVELVRLQVR
ncbi:hypothetical protein N9980_01225 [bacterium]|nr:hypothetical protein [bacterium]